MPRTGDATAAYTTSPPTPHRDARRRYRQHDGSTIDVSLRAYPERVATRRLHARLTSLPSGMRATSETLLPANTRWARQILEVEQPCNASYDMHGLTWSVYGSRRPGPPVLMLYPGDVLVVHSPVRNAPEGMPEDAIAVHICINLLAGLWFTVEMPLVVRHPGWISMIRGPLLEWFTLTRQQRIVRACYLANQTLRTELAHTEIELDRVSITAAIRHFEEVMGSVTGGIHANAHAVNDDSIRASFTEWCQHCVATSGRSMSMVRNIVRGSVGITPDLRLQTTLQDMISTDTQRSDRDLSNTTNMLAAAVHTIETEQTHRARCRQFIGILGFLIRAGDAVFDARLRNALASYCHSRRLGIPYTELKEYLQEHYAVETSVIEIRDALRTLRERPWETAEPTTAPATTERQPRRIRLRERSDTEEPAT